MAMLTVDAIFRRVMGMKCGHGSAAVQTEVYRTWAGGKTGIFYESPKQLEKTVQRPANSKLSHPGVHSEALRAKPE
jgi:hypothetical protein